MPERALPPVDFRIIQQISESPAMMADQGSGFMSQYGGSQGFVELDKSGIGDVYNYIKMGASTEELPVLSGLPNSEINYYLQKLQKLGVIEPIAPMALE